MSKIRSPEPDISARQSLLACATNLFNQRGYAATTVREIVEAAGVTKPVLYYYFGSKEGIFREIMEHLLKDFEQRLETCLGRKGTAAERVRGLCDEMFSLFLEHIDYARLVYSICFGPAQGAPFFDFNVFYAKVGETLRRMAEEGIRTGEFRKGNPQDFALAILGTLNVAIEVHLTQPEMAIGHQGLARILDAIFSGIAAQTPLAKDSQT